MSENGDYYKNYFSHRNIAPDCYCKHKLPRYIERVLPPSSASILEIGCGFGQIIKTLRERGYINVEGVDISKEAVEHCTMQNLAVRLISDLSTFCNSTDKKYDFVIMSHVLEHLEKAAIIHTLQSIKQKLMKPEALLLIMVPNAQSNTGCYWAYEDFTHHTLFTAGSLYFVLKSAGFQSVEFLDPNGLEGHNAIVRTIKWLLLYVYKIRIKFWNMVTSSFFHRPNLQIFTFELKAIAK